MRVIAVDWSGAKQGASRWIWLAEVRDGHLVRLENGRPRERLADHLIALADEDPDLIVGLDFAFSLPSWFLQERELETAYDLWRLAEEEGEGWLADCDPPFWGRPGRARPDLAEHFRHTDRRVPAVSGIRPKSPFQIGGAGAVGTGSLRGMPILRRLSDAGFAIWPFQEARTPLVIEIYPRLLTGAIRKSDPGARRRFLESRLTDGPADFRKRAVGSPDAFDAAVSVLKMARHRREILALEATTDPRERLEGVIWHPGLQRVARRTGSADSHRTARAVTDGMPAPPREAPVAPGFSVHSASRGISRSLTSESVTEGHPDKVCDYIADSILDAYLEADARAGEGAAATAPSRVACEVLCKGDVVVLAGEITPSPALGASRVDHEAVVRAAVREIGYTDPAESFHADGLRITDLVGRQAEEIARGVSSRCTGQATW